MTTPAAVPLVPADAPVVEVSVLEDRARVIRRGTVAVPAGQSRLVIARVAPVLVDKTLTATAGAARVVDVRCRRALAPWATGQAAGDAAARAVDAATLRARADEVGAEVARLEAEVTVIEREAADVVRLAEVVLAELGGDAAWGRLPGDAATRLDALDARDRALTAEVAQRRLALARARRDLGSLRARADEAARDAGRDRADVEIDVVADADAEVTLELEYLVPGACWRPYHTATLQDGAVTIATDACVWQATGEDWTDAALSFSTERPSLGAAPPRLVSDELHVQRKSDTLVVEARDQELETTGLGVDAPARAVAAAVPGVDDGGVTQVLRAPHPATVPADGRPYRVRLGDHRADAEVALVAFPERSPCVFTRSRQVNGPRPLLAGPVDLIRDHGQVGRTSILYVAPGERFDLGWGPEPDVRLHRDERRKRDEAGVLGSWHTTRVRVAVRLSNLGRAARTVEVTERIPVSEIDKVEIKVAAADAWQLEDDDGERRDDTPLCTTRTVDDDGLARWVVEVPPRSRRAVALEYQLRAHTSVVGL
ncbi:MAG: mucoidy inhibitor MuiA family protein [Kofleriaceae bacterium]|nr:mucoidy inhibitor MuiA family protein [Kofleriaceae bacterium]